MFAMWIQSQNRKYLGDAQNQQKKLLNGKICDVEAANQEYFDLHYHCEQCQDEHNLFEQHYITYQQLIQIASLIHLFAIQCILDAVYEISFKYKQKTEV